MKTFIQPGETVTVTAPSGGAVSGVGYMTGNLFGVWAFSADAGADCEMTTEGVFDIAKDTSSYSVGDAVYWDEDNKKASASGFSAGLTRIGVAIVAAVSGDSSVRCRLDGFVTRAAQL